ncbi:hypothetical protein N7523_007979 [Penicillium sp. IBT 18751x]|nr:hypothetical protein N7523_007979 [Penicillium sp. IBT 18751x]
MSPEKHAGTEEDEGWATHAETRNQKPETRNNSDRGSSDLSQLAFTGHPEWNTETANGECFQAVGNGKRDTRNGKT